MVVVLGVVQLSSTATIDGDLVVVGGGSVISSGAQVQGDLVVVVGTYDAPADFVPGGEHVVIGRGALGGRLDPLVPWVTRGLLWGRPIVPDLGWVWNVVGIFFLVSLVLNLVFDRPIRACAETLVEKPLSALAVGLLVMLLAGPVCLLLAVSVVGLAVVPFVFCALLLAWIVGKVGVARGIGMTIVRQTSPESRIQALRSFVIGFSVICVAYMVPVLGLAAWAIGGVFGLGAAMLSIIAGYRREHPAPLPRVPSVEATPARYPNGTAALFQYGDPSPVPVREPVPTPPVHEAVEGDYAPSAPPVSSAEKGYGPFAASAEALAMADLVSFPRAPFRDRLAAFVLDVILVAIAQTLLDAFLPAPPRLSHRILGVEGDDRRRHHLSAPRDTRRRHAASLRRCARAGLVQHFLAGSGRRLAACGSSKTPNGRPGTTRSRAHTSSRSRRTGRSEGVNLRLPRT